MEEIHTKIWNKEKDQVYEGVIRVSDDEDCVIQVEKSINEVWGGKGKDFYSSLNLIREKMEQQGLYILCNGSRLDVVPSGMSRQMSKGRKIYQIRISKQALREDLLDIFQIADKKHIASVREQKNYYQKWIASLK